MPESQFLYEQFDAVSRLGLLKKDIPSEILDNLNPKFELRAYQEEAFARFFYYLNHYPERITPTHLLFNMATGSGKTLIMAGLMLYLYQRGYRNFLFFVNTTNIIEKTKDNFLNPYSSKYLFNEKIIINGRVVQIAQVDNFEAVGRDDLNISFTTIQKLHTDLYLQRENRMTLDDFADKEVVLLSDESHHIQAETKQRSLSKALEKPSWENTVQQIFEKNINNMLLEFTATLDSENTNILNKYKDRVLYRYDLKEFRNDGYSKDVHILQSDFEEKERILQAIILNQYREEVAVKHKIALKPVILFKAQKTIEQSHENQSYFNALIDALSVSDIVSMREHTLTNPHGVPVLRKAFEFFRFEEISDHELIQKLKTSFAPNKCINVNEKNLDHKSIKKADQKELRVQQQLLNSLEDKENQIRAIFAVQKLNEGWDVLNLFDIVRLNAPREDKSSQGRKNNSTIAEAQLIGRGARYFPFHLDQGESKYTRKFDLDLEHELRIIEELHYHSVNDVAYIRGLRRELVEKGLIEPEEEDVKLTLKEEFKQQELFKSGVIYLNDRIKNKNEAVKSFADLKVRKRNIRYRVSSAYGEDRAIFNQDKIDNESESSYQSRELKLSEIDVHIIQNAISKHTFFDFEHLKRFFPHLRSVREFISSKDYLSGLAITFEEREGAREAISNKNLLNAVIELLKFIKTEVEGNTTEYKGLGEFKPVPIANKFYDKVLKIDKNSERYNGQEGFLKNKSWYVFNANYGTSEEKRFVEMMDSLIGEFKKRFEDIYLIRNELFVKIYNFHDGQGFAPDFVLFMRKKNGKTSTYQIFIEPKGKHLRETDRWKEEFLNEIKEMHKDKIVRLTHSENFKIIGMPFYNHEDENIFKSELINTLD